MNKRFLVEVMKNSKNSKKNNYNDNIDEMKKIKRRFKILEDKTQELEESDPRKFLIKSDILNLVVEMNNYLIKKKCE